MHYQEWAKNVLENKSSGAFNFIGAFALKMCNNSQNLIIKMTQYVTSQSGRKRYWEQKTLMKAMWYTVDSRYLEVEVTFWNTSRYPYFDISDLQNWGKYQLNNQISQMNM